MVLKAFSEKIEFSNDGNLSLFFIGTGSAFSHEYFQTNLLIIKGKTHLLVDCGTLCAYTFEKQYNTKLSNVQNLLLTHAHADHVGGVEELAFYSKYALRSKINLIIPNKFKKILWNQTLKGSFKYNEDGVLCFTDYFNQFNPQKIQTKPFEVYKIDFYGINLKLFRTRHVAIKNGSLNNSGISYGLIIDDRILFTGDTQFNPKQIEFLNNKFKFECIFHDCDVSGTSKAVHATYDELKTLNQDIKKIMYLNHYDSSCKKVDPIKDGFKGFAQRGVYYNF